MLSTDMLGAYACVLFPSCAARAVSHGILLVYYGLLDCAVMHCNMFIDDSGVVIYCSASLRVMLWHSGTIVDFPRSRGSALELPLPVCYRSYRQSLPS